MFKFVSSFQHSLWLAAHRQKIGSAKCNFPKLSNNNNTIDNRQIKHKKWSKSATIITIRREKNNPKILCIKKYWKHATQSMGHIESVNIRIYCRYGLASCWLLQLWISFGFYTFNENTSNYVIQWMPRAYMHNASIYRNVDSIKLPEITKTKMRNHTHAIRLNIVSFLNRLHDSVRPSSDRPPLTVHFVQMHFLLSPSSHSSCSFISFDRYWVLCLWIGPLR